MSSDDHDNDDEDDDQQPSLPLAMETGNFLQQPPPHPLSSHTTITTAAELSSALSEQQTAVPTRLERDTDHISIAPIPP